MDKRTRFTGLQTEAYHTIPSKLIHLDGENPRHDSLDREPEIISALWDDQLINLATDIARRGSLSPLDLMGVIESEGMPGHFVAVEGNRRTCALILLSDPARAPSVELRNVFKRLAKDAKTPSELHVYLFESRDKAKQWIELRHLGAQDGIGTREWSPEAKAKAAMRSSANTSAKADILAVKIVERLFALGLISAEQKNDIHVTTLSRYLNNKTRRAILGIEGLTEENQLLYTHTPSEVDAALQRFVLDSLSPDGKTTPRVNSRARAKDCDTYIGELASEGYAPVTALEKPISPPDPKPRSSAEKSSESHTLSRGRSTPNPTLRNRFISSSFTVRHPDKVLNRLRHEMLKQPIDDHEFAANYLLRAFVERILVLYLRHNCPTVKHRSEEDLCKHCANHASSSSDASRGVKQVLNQAASNIHAAHSLHTLGTAVHGSTVPVKKNLLAAFDTWEPALQYMLNSLHT
jgi:hypothetical protein